MHQNGGAEFTAWVLVILLFLAIGFDVYTGFRIGTHASISAQLLSISQRYPVLAFAAGILAGHIFWPQWASK